MVIDSAKEIRLEDLLSLISKTGRFERMGDIAHWFSGDYSCYYWVFTNENGIALEIVDGYGSLWVSVFEKNDNYKDFWDCTMKFKGSSRSKDDMEEILRSYGFEVGDA